MTAMMTHFAGSTSCAERREADSETTNPCHVSCLRCRHAIGARVAEQLGPARVTWVARVWGWLGEAA